jgi:hypothetical protein
MQKKIVSVQWIYEQDRGHSHATDEALSNYYKLLKEKLSPDSPIFREHSAEDLIIFLTERYFLNEQQFEESNRDETKDFAFNIGYQTDNLARICDISWHLARNNVDPLLILSTPIFYASLQINNANNNFLLEIVTRLLDNQLGFAQQARLTELLQYYRNYNSAPVLNQMIGDLQKIITP